MEALSIIGMLLMLFGFANAAWAGLLYVLSLSAIAGTKLSKKLGTSNEKTDANLDKGVSMSNDLLKKVIWRLLLGCIGWLMFYVATGHS
ncbi:hypothetical protein EZL74_03240 [Flavobacterium silvisoli]|uniref:Uncharacterized protein n=1 Tax=Flavobacterium silvisoli TaxID=2529433 RepID=A0A4Q9Z2W4_9FLAO|nr:hypothetical protein [Flavobacterium silvisoli]TBX70701.1 hypothetical protein EZL74_03240 [Flavobacterium silvisoli]